MQYYDLYRKYHALGEERRWCLEKDVAWADIDPALANRDLLQPIKIAALVESFSYQNCARFFQAHRHLPWLIGWKVMNLYEENRHHYAMLRYSEAIGLPIEEREIVAIQHGYQTSTDLQDSVWAGADLLEELVLAWISEIETAVWYRLAGRHVGEPVGTRLFGLISADEFFHAAYYHEVIARMIAEDPEARFASIATLISRYGKDDRDDHYGVVIGRDVFAEVRNTMARLGAADEIRQIVKSRLGAWQGLVAAPGV
ncbi:MAG: acyl-ACP desaturase [bacterium]|nr:acyl-ACP desaturase [bacterium]